MWGKVYSVLKGIATAFVLYTGGKTIASDGKRGYQYVRDRVRGMGMGGGMDDMGDMGHMGGMPPGNPADAPISDPANDLPNVPSVTVSLSPDLDAFGRSGSVVGIANTVKPGGM